MAISCDPSSLANAARCFLDCHHSHSLAQSVKSYLLCQYSNVPVGPPPPTNPDIADASVFNDVIFTWSNPTPAGTSNEVWKSVNGAAFVLYSTVGGGVSSFHDPLPLAVNAFWTYKVRTISTAVTSAFSATRSVCYNITKTGAADAALSFPDLVMCIDNAIGLGGIACDNMPNLTSFSAPLLRRVDARFVFNGDAALTSVSLPVLDNVGLAIGDNFLFDNCTALPTLSLPAFKQIGNGGGNFHLTGCTSLASVSFPVLFNVGGDFLFDGCTALTSISCPALTGVAEKLGGTGSAFTTASFPLLLSIGTDCEFIGCPNLTTLTLSVLNDIQGALDVTNCTALQALNVPLLANVAGSLNAPACTSLTSFNLNSLQTVGGDLTFFNSTALLSASLPALTAVTGNVIFSGCSSLASLSIPSCAFGQNFRCVNCTNLATVTLTNATFANGGFFIEFTNCKVTAGTSAAGTGINGILRRGIVSATTTDDYELAGGTNAPPNNAAGNTGLTDKATLIGNGNTVNTN